MQIIKEQVRHSSLICDNENHLTIAPFLGTETNKDHRESRNNTPRSSHVGITNSSPIPSTRIISPIVPFADTHHRTSQTGSNTDSPVTTRGTVHPSAASKDVQAIRNIVTATPIAPVPATASFHPDEKGTEIIPCSSQSQLDLILNRMKSQVDVDEVSNFIVLTFN